MSQREDDDIRFGKWLWSACFFKTRSSAAEAVSSGKIEINGDRPRPSRAERAGDRLTIRHGPYEWTVVLKDGSRLRALAAKAHLLYQEAQESLRKREAAIAQLKLQHPPGFASPRHPSKKTVAPSRALPNAAGKDGMLSSYFLDLANRNRYWD
jgi:ribosome-associated heat shock protein Hsp15